MMMMIVMVMVRMTIMCKPDFVRACAVEMCVNMSQEQLGMENYREKSDLDFATVKKKKRPQNGWQVKHSHVDSHDFHQESLGVFGVAGLQFYFCFFCFLDVFLVAS